MSQIDMQAIESLKKSLQDTKSDEDAAWCVMDEIFEESERYSDTVIYLVDDTGDYLIQTAAKGEKIIAEHMIKNPIVVPRGEGIVGVVLSTGRPRLLADTTRDSNYIIDDRFRLSELAVPIVFNKKIYGVLDSEHSDENFFNKEDQAFFEQVAAVFAEHLAQL